MIRPRMVLQAWVTAVSISLVMAGQVARAGVIVSPGADQSTLGNSDNLLPFLTTNNPYSTLSHIQQLYPSSDFGSMTSPQYIDQIAFRTTLGQWPFSATIPNISVTLSTTNLGPGQLSSTFANNTGANASVVFQGPLTIYSTDDKAPGGQTHTFDVAISFQKPFLYDPTKGNLLVDIKMPAPATISSASYNIDLEAQTTPAATRVYSYGGLAQFFPNQVIDENHGLVDNISLVTQFRTGGPDPIPQPGVPSTVPEPSTLALLGASVFGLLIRHVRRGRAARDRD